MEGLFQVATPVCCYTAPLKIQCFLPFQVLSSSPWNGRQTGWKAICISSAASVKDEVLPPLRQESRIHKTLRSDFTNLTSRSQNGNGNRKIFHLCYNCNKGRRHFLPSYLIFRSPKNTRDVEEELKYHGNFPVHSLFCLQWYFIKLRFPSFLNCYNTITLYSVASTNGLFHLENYPRDKKNIKPAILLLQKGSY